MPPGCELIERREPPLAQQLTGNAGLVGLLVGGGCGRFGLLVLLFIRPHGQLQEFED